MKAKNYDDRDAEAIAEAATRPTTRFVPVKSEGQSNIQALHRARSRLMAERTVNRAASPNTGGASCASAALEAGTTHTAVHGLVRSDKRRNPKSNAFM